MPYNNEPPGRLDVQIKLCNKKMKKRKQLDALVSGDKPGKRFKSSSFANGSSHGLLKNYSDSSDLEDFNVIRKRRCRKNLLTKRMCTAFFPVIVFILVTACIIATATLVWLHLILRSNLDILRLHLQKVESNAEETPEALHTLHAQIKKITTDLDSLKLQMGKALFDIRNNTKELQYLRKASGQLKESLPTAPMLEGLPKTIESLSQNIASMGSKILAMETTVKDLKVQHVELQNNRQQEISDMEMMKSSVHEIWNEVNTQKRNVATTLSLSANSSNTSHILTQLDEEIKSLNQGLTKMNRSINNDIKANIEKALNLYQDQQRDLNNLHEYVYNNLTEISSNGRGESFYPKDFNLSFNGTHPPSNWSIFWKDVKDISQLYQNLQSKFSLQLNDSGHSANIESFLEVIEKYLEDQLHNVSKRIGVIELETNKLKDESTLLRNNYHTNLNLLRNCSCVSSTLLPLMELVTTEGSNQNSSVTSSSHSFKDFETPTSVTMLSAERTSESTLNEGNLPTAVRNNESSSSVSTSPQVP